MTQNVEAVFTQVTADGEVVPYPRTHNSDSEPLLCPSPTIVETLRQNKRAWEALTLPLDIEWYKAMTRILEGAVAVGLPEADARLLYEGSWNYPDGHTSDFMDAAVNDRYELSVEKYNRHRRLSVNGILVLPQADFVDWGEANQSRFNCLVDMLTPLIPGEPNCCTLVHHGDWYRFHAQRCHGSDSMNMDNRAVAEWRISEAEPRPEDAMDWSWTHSALIAQNKGRIASMGRVTQ